VLAWLGLIDWSWSDYDAEASAAFRALSHGDIVGFLQAAPSYGGSLVLRAPFAAIPALWGGGDLAVFRAGSLLCLFAAGALGVYLVARLRAEGRSLLERVTVMGLCVCSPIAMRALEIGHPEEILGAVLCVGAVLAALRGRITWSAVLLGLAIATKAWGVLAIGPVLLALPRARWRALIVAGAVTLAVLSPLAIAGHENFRATTAGIGTTGHIFTPSQAWWFFGDHGVVTGPDGKIKVGYRAAPAWVSGINHQLIVALAIPLTLALVLLRRRRARPDEALLLLALLLHLRCLFDAWNNVYYALPCLFALLAWEAVGRRRAPVVTLTATVVLWVHFEKLMFRVTADQEAAIYLAWAVPVVFLLAAELYAPELVRRTATKVQRRVRKVSPGGHVADQTA
jgi:hypothetical protein